MVTLPLHNGALQIFDVEHGGCALLTIPRADRSGCHRVMFDCGHNATTKWYPGEHLKRMGVDRLELLVVTNYDEDHVSGFRNLIEQGIAINQILRNPAVSPATIRHLKTQDGMGIGIETLVNVLTLIPEINVVGGQIPSLPHVNLEWFWNPYPFFEDENNLSLVTVLQAYGVKFMFCGDMEKPGFRNMLNTNERFRSVVSEIHVLMAAHHGRANGICEEMFDVWGCNPEVVVISDDYKQYNTQETTNYYGRRAKGVVGFRDSLSLRKVLTTRSDGELLFSFQDVGCIVS
jgi:beta-lactamase superfamily II metal-dependent hydrolase